MPSQPAHPRAARQFGLIAVALTVLLLLGAVLAPPGSPAVAQQAAPTPTFIPIGQLTNIMSVVVAGSLDAATPMREYRVSVGNDNTLIVGALAQSSNLRVRIEVFAVGNSTPSCTRHNVKDGALLCNQSSSGPNLNRVRVTATQGSGSFLVFANVNPGTQEILINNGEESETMTHGDQFMRWAQYVSDTSMRLCVDIRNADNTLAAPPANLIARIYDLSGQSICSQNGNCSFTDDSTRYFVFVANASGAQQRVFTRFRTSCP